MRFDVSGKANIGYRLFAVGDSRFILIKDLSRKIRWQARRCYEKDGGTFMKDLEVRTDSFIGYIPKNKKDYLKFIQLILRYADSVCFQINPFLDNIDEFNRSIWGEMADSVLDYGFARAASDPENVKHHLVLLNKDYFVWQFLKERKGIFDYTQEDSGLGITLEDPAFIKDGKVFCYTVTHEKICIVAEDIYTRL